MMYAEGIGVRENIGKGVEYLKAEGNYGPAAEAVEPLGPGMEAYREFQKGLEGLRQGTVPLLTDLEVHRLRGEAELGAMFALGALAVVGDRKRAYDLWYLSGSTIILILRVLG